MSSTLSNRFFKLIAVLACLTAGAFVTAASRAEDEIPEPSDRVQINQTVTDGFIHPGIGLTREILENARKQVLAKKEPWLSGYAVLASDPHSAKRISCRNQSARNPAKPDVDAFDNPGIENRLTVDASKAKCQALMYFFTGDEVYRANAMNIIRVWSQMDPTKYKPYRECYIHCAYPTQNLIIAAELMRYTTSGDMKLAWTQQDTGDFNRNFVVPAISTFFDGNGWFMNQNAYPLAASMAGDIFTNNGKSYERRVEWFTVNKTAPNKGWSSSIADLARKVDTNALTGQKVTPPVVQLMEMGRDQAHAGDDVEIFTNTARMMNAQGTKVDPVSGTISTGKDAVGPYEFLDDRILAATDEFCRFMLGYDTPWIPAAYDIGPDGAVRAIYPRIADNYRGRIRELECWDLYYYYACKKGINLAEKAPYYCQAFTKRIVSSDTEWIFIPANATGEGAKVPPRVEEPAVVEVARRSTLLDGNAAVVEEAAATFVRVMLTEAGARLAILSAATDKKIIGLRIRTTGVSEVTMSGYENSWLLPNTQGQWRDVAYSMDQLERFRDIEYLSIKGASDIQVDLDSLYRTVDAKHMPPAFRCRGGPVQEIAYVGAPIKLDFSAAERGSGNLVLSSSGLPPDARLNGETGDFSWRPAREGEYTFFVNLSDGNAVAVRKATIYVTRDRDSAVRKVLWAYNKDTPYVRGPLERFEARANDVKGMNAETDNEAFYSKLMQLEETADALKPLTPILPDGSMNYPRIVVSSTIGDSIALLIDGNNDTFPVYTLAKDLSYVFDFGPGYQVSVSAFALQGRLNFEDRAAGTAFFGSNDAKTWTQITRSITGLPVNLTRVDVEAAHLHDRFRYLKIGKTGRNSSPLFEPSELRIYGQRHEVE